MKKMILLCLALMMMIPALALAGGSVLLVELPQDAQMIENVQFEDGDFIQTYQLTGGAQVQLLRYASFDMSLEDLAASEWVGYTDAYGLDIEQIGGHPAQSLRFVWAENGKTSYDVTLILIKTADAALVFEAVFPASMGESGIDAALDAMLTTMDVTSVGEHGATETAEVG